MALKKIQHYCGYQERCHKEVREKLYQLELSTKDVNDIMATLIETNYLNEERFAKQYAGGKFRMKQWGRRKIEAELLRKQISRGLVKTALEEIDPATYIKVLQKIASQKWNSLAALPSLERKSKTTFLLLQKGYEPALVAKAINILVASTKKN